MIKKAIYILKYALLTLVVKFPAVIIGDALVIMMGLNFPPYTSDQQIVDPTVVDFFTAVIFAPIIETIIGQMLPLWLISKITTNTTLKILFSAAVFAALHLPVLGFVPAAFVVGIIFAKIYLDNRKYGRKSAFAITTAVHLIHNLIAFLLAVAATLGGLA